jgi:hypothetical protein
MMRAGTKPGKQRSSPRQGTGLLPAVANPSSALPKYHRLCKLAAPHYAMQPLEPMMADDDRYGSIKGPYTQRSVSARIEALFLDNLGKVITREMIIEVATNPKTGKVPENWHQRRMALGFS